jgi:hypothetical protein
VLCKNIILFLVVQASILSSLHNSSFKETESGQKTPSGFWFLSYSILFCKRRQFSTFVIAVFPRSRCCLTTLLRSLCLTTTFFPRPAPPPPSVFTQRTPIPTLSPTPPLSLIHICPPLSSVTQCCVSRSHLPPPPVCLIVLLSVAPRPICLLVL